MPRACIVLLFLLAPRALVAQEATALTEEAFLAAVTGEHPAAVALTGERELAAAEALRASLLPNPEIEASVEDPDGGARETTAGVTWTPPLDGRRALRREAAEKGLAAAESRVEAARLRLRLDLRAVYADWAFAWERRELLAAHLVQLGELAERARARAEAGEIPGLAARRFTLEEAQARADLGRAEARLAGSRAALAAWAPNIPPEVRPAAPPLLPLPTPAVAPDLASRPDLVAREREVERAETLRRLSDRIFEAPALGLGWKRIEDRSGEASGPVVSAGWTVPLFDRRQADRREAEARLATSRAELELARTRAQAEQAGALAAYDRLRTEAAAADRSAAEAGELLTGAAAAYQLGESGLTDFLDTLRAALAARIAALEMREAALTTQRELEAATGRPLTGDLP
jgi:cobalt-zinc-cadmium efflux system outer membrane protein